MYVYVCVCVCVCVTVMVPVTQEDGFCRLKGSVGRLELANLFFGNGQFGAQICGLFQQLVPEKNKVRAVVGQ